MGWFKRLRYFALLCELLLITTNSFAVPRLDWMSDFVGKDGRLLIYGTGFTNLDKVLFSTAMNQAKEKNIPGEILSNSDSVLVVKVPEEFRSKLGKFSLLGDFKKVEGYINAPKIKWHQMRASIIAEGRPELHLIGVRLSSVNLVRLCGENGIRHNLVFRKISHWELVAELPVGLINGFYSLYYQTKDGEAEFEYKGLEITDGLKENITDVRKFKRLDARAGMNMAPSINLALSELHESGGGDLILTGGRFYLRSALFIPPKVNLIGQGRDKTVLIFSGLNNVPDALVYGHTDLSISDLSIYADNHLDIIRLGGFDQVVKESKNITVSNIKIRGNVFSGRLPPDRAAFKLKQIKKYNKNGVAAIRVNASGFNLVNSDISSSSQSLVLYKSNNSIIDSNRLVNGRGGWYSISGSSFVIFKNNSIEGGDLEASGGGVNTIDVGYSPSFNVFFYNNRFQNFQGWDGEAITTDSPGNVYYGNVYATDEVGVYKLHSPVDIGSLNYSNKFHAFFFNRHGESFFSEVGFKDRDHISLNRNLNFGQQSGLVVSIVAAHSNYILVNNFIMDARVAVQVFGTGVDHIIADNELVRSGGIVVDALDYPHPQSIWNVQIVNNRIIDGGSPSKSIIGIRDRSSGLGGGFLKNIFVNGNEFFGDGEILACVDEPSRSSDLRVHISSNFSNGEPLYVKRNGFCK